MDIRIEASEHAGACKVWLGNNVVSFPSYDEAMAYLTQLQERIAAAAHSFVEQPTHNEPA